MARHRWRGVAALTAVFPIGGGASMVLIGEGGVLQHKGRRGVRYRPPIGGRTSMDGAHRGGERMATVAPTAVVALRWRGWTGGKGKRWRVTCGPVGRRKKKEGAVARQQSPLLNGAVARCGREWGPIRATPHGARSGRGVRRSVRRRQPAAARSRRVRATWASRPLQTGERGSLTGAPSYSTGWHGSNLV
jgi:hypothetical protein